MFKMSVHSSTDQLGVPSIIQNEDAFEYDVEKVVAKISDPYNNKNDLFEVVWKGYPGENTWQTREQLKRAKYTVACFEHPEKVSQLTDREVKFYGAGKKQDVKKVILNYKSENKI